MLKAKTALKSILGISIAGLLFSGYLSFGEIFKQNCTLGCSAGDSGNLFGIPVCVYGFFMYLVIFIITSLSLINRK